MRVYDLSPTLSETTGVFPGDTAFRRDIAMSFEQGHHLGLSSITTTLHIGAHADSPAHYIAKGLGIDRRDPSIYIGKTLVMRAKVTRGERVSLKHFDSEFRKRIEDRQPLPGRFLVHTGTFPNPQSWNSNFASYDPEFIEALAACGVRLIGIDTPSIDPETSVALESHHVVERLNLAVLEGLCLDDVPDGREYLLVAAPLKIKNGDAGPVRALLFEGNLTHTPLRHPEDEPKQFTWIECEKVR